MFNSLNTRNAPREESASSSPLGQTLSEMTAEHPHVVIDDVKESIVVVALGLPPPEDTEFIAWRQKVEAAVKDTTSAVIIDLSAAQHFPHTMIGAMLNLNDALVKLGKKVVFCGITPQALEVMGIIKLHDRLKIAENRASAQQLLGNS